jgi:hypothetical protein
MLKNKEGLVEFDQLYMMQAYCFGAAEKNNLPLKDITKQEYRALVAHGTVTQSVVRSFEGYINGARTALKLDSKRRFALSYVETRDGLSGSRTIAHTDMTADQFAEASQANESYLGNTLYIALLLTDEKYTISAKQVLRDNKKRNSPGSLTEKEHKSEAVQADETEKTPNKLDKGKRKVNSDSDTNSSSDKRPRSNTSSPAPSVSSPSQSKV